MDDKQFVPMMPSGNTPLEPEPNYIILVIDASGNPLRKDKVYLSTRPAIGEAILVDNEAYRVKDFVNTANLPVVKVVKI